MAIAGKSCASCGGNYGSEVLFCPLDGTPLSSSRTLTASPNEIDPYLFLELHGQIQLNALVGIGSMGRVYRAFQAGVERDVAVKILHRELTGNQELVARFHREAKIASRLVHPNVVQVLMTGTLAPSSDMRVGGEVYLVMEYLDGISLLSALAAQGEGGALPLARTLHIVLQLCDAVGEAHANNIVHRDLKPENIMLVRRSEDPDFVKVLDFGIARLDSAIEGSTTQAGLIFGTAKYISPEGAEGKHVGPQADCYAIATIIYECLAGRTPFVGDSPMALLVQQIHGTPADLRSIPRAAYVPEPIARVVMGNLSKDPEERSENARAFGRELSLAARDAGLHLDTMHGGAPRGDLRLLSKQRTRQHEFSADLKAKIASINTSGPPSSTNPGANGTSNGAGVTPSGANGVTSSTEARSANGAAPEAGSARPMTTYEELGDQLQRPGMPAPSAPGPSRPGLSQPPRPGHTEIGARPSRPAPTQIALDAQHGPGHTQLADEDVTITGTLEKDGSPANGTVQRLREQGILERPSPTVAGSPIGSPIGAGEITERPFSHDPNVKPGGTPPEAHVEGPISSAKSQAPDTVASSRAANAPTNDNLAGSPSAKQPASRARNEKNEKGPPPLPGNALAGSPRAKPTDPTLNAEPVVKKPRFTSLGEPIVDMPPPRPVTWKAFAVIASLLVIVPVGALAAARILGKRPAQTQTFDTTLEAAQEAMEKRAWDAPAGANVKELTDKLLQQSPGDSRVLQLRATAAERIVNDGIRAKSSGDIQEARRLFKLASELSDLDTAKVLLKDLETPSPTSTVAVPAPTPTPEPLPPPTSSSGKVNAKAPGTSKPGSTNTVAPKSSGNSIEIPLPDLTPPPPPPPPASSSSGPFI